MQVVASAPGKVLITGGYLVLERPNAGLVLSTNARFFAIVKPLYEDINPESWAWSWTDVKISSPQLSRETMYKLSLKQSNLQCIDSRDPTNPFVEQAVQYSIAASKANLTEKGMMDALLKLLLQGLHITIIGANDFYSYRNQIEACGLSLTPDALASLPPFSPVTFNVADSNGVCAGTNTKPEVAKTGLGSSAAMTTSVVAALLHYLGVTELSSSVDNATENQTAGANLDLVHIVSQSAHCIAQGKIGSGFDVSAAVYGSQKYVRFSSSVLSAQAIGGKNLPDVIIDILKEKWDHEKISFSLPPMMNLLLGEPGSGGSSTVSLVGSVKQWKKSDPQGSSEIWRRLVDANSLLERELRALSKCAEEQWEAYKHVISSCSGHSCETWMEVANGLYEETIVKSLLGTRYTFLEIRSQMRAMGEAAGVPIEPESQTHLLDETMNMKGVLFAGIPGAGGFDAIFAVTLDDSTKKISESWSSLGILPLLVREDPRGVSLENSDPRH